MKIFVIFIVTLLAVSCGNGLGTVSSDTKDSLMLDSIKKDTISQDSIKIDSVFKGD